MFLCIVVLLKKYHRKVVSEEGDIREVMCRQEVVGLALAHSVLWCALEKDTYFKTIYFHLLANCCNMAILLEQNTFLP